MNFYVSKLKLVEYKPVQLIVISSTKFNFKQRYFLQKIITQVVFWFNVKDFNNLFENYRKNLNA